MKLKKPSYAMMRSIKAGDQIHVGKTVYSGKTPEYQFANNMQIKVKPGIPFVNLNKLDLSDI